MQLSESQLTANTYLATNEDALKNGSYFRVTGRKKFDRFAHYINGDFISFVNKLPNGLNLQLQRKEAKKLIPKI
jgi:hypothetical protein